MLWISLEWSSPQISDFKPFSPDCISKNVLRPSTSEVSTCTKVNCCNVFACPSRMGKPVELHFSNLVWDQPEINYLKINPQINWALQCLFPLLSCRLALYVYEYLLHVGAQKSAQTFLSEVSDILAFQSKRLLLYSLEIWIRIQGGFCCLINELINESIGSNCFVSASVNCYFFCNMQSYLQLFYL